MDGKRLLITGFDPFGGQSINPAWEAVKSLPERIGAFEVHELEIPTVFGLAARKVLEEAERCRPDVILCIGQAGGRTDVTPERVGINLRDARICDNAGNQPQEEPIVAGGPDAYFSTLPVKRIAQAIQAAGYPGSVSNSAGTFVCNDVLYSLLHHYAGTNVQVGFIHVPFLPEQGTPNLLLDRTVAALEAAIKSI